MLLFKLHKNCLDLVKSLINDGLNIYLILHHTLRHLIIFRKNSMRQSPTKVIPVIHKGIQYSAPEDQLGYIYATDVKTDETIWTKQIYKNDNEAIETDMNNSFIKDLEIKDGEIKVINEDSSVFSMNIDTRVVSKN